MVIVQATRQISSCSLLFCPLLYEVSLCVFPLTRCPCVCFLSRGILVCVSSHAVVPSLFDLSMRVLIDNIDGECSVCVHVC